jgi:hypothetical protein
MRCSGWVHMHMERALGTSWNSIEHMTFQIRELREGRKEDERCRTELFIVPHFKPFFFSLSTLYYLLQARVVGYVNCDFDYDCRISEWCCQCTGTRKMSHLRH